MKKLRPFHKAMIVRFFIVSIFFSLFCLICSNVRHSTNLVSNINGVRSLKASYIVSSYNNNSKLEAREVSTMSEALLYGGSVPIYFIGQMTAYNPICRGCTGRVACQPGQDVRNGNIYYNDEIYGKIRILAADPAIPCGTLVKITNVTFSSEPIIGIVLDRGGLIKGNIMDFLVTEVDDMDVIGRQRNVRYEVLRWGW